MDVQKRYVLEYLLLRTHYECRKYLLIKSDIWDKSLRSSEGRDEDLEAKSSLISVHQSCEKYQVPT